MVTSKYSPAQWRLISPGAGLERLYNGLVNLLDLILGPLQSRIGTRGMAYVFVLPNLLIFGIFILLPMVTNFFYTFTGGNNLFIHQRPFVGTQNLQRLFDCSNFFDPNTCREDLFARSVSNTVLFVVIQVALMVLVSLITALALNRKIMARGFFRSVFFYPVLLSPVVVALIWKWILRDGGLLDAVIVGLGGQSPDFLTSSDWAKFWVIVVSVWSLMGFYTLILLAGLQSIPGELYEAAKIDGANDIQSFSRVTLPLLMPTMLVVLVLSLIRAVQVFDVVFAFTGGGPGTATMYIVQFIYNNGFASPSKEYGLAAAASMVMAASLVVLTMLQLRLRREDVL